jgi:uncharacterized membrane protein YuzA (DUF378 family)
MKVIIEHLGYVVLGLAAIFWLLSALVKLTGIAPGLDQLDLVTALSGDLQRMARCNFWAALLTGIGTMAQITVRYWP